MDHRAELVEVIRRIRNRWRMRLAARGAVVVFVGTVLALLLSASSLETFRFSVPAIITFRILALAIFAALVVYAIMPLRRQVSDTQVALYLEEHNPSLEAAILSAVETAPSSATDDRYSPRLVERLVEQAIAQSHAIDNWMAIDRPRMRRHALTLASFAAAAALFITFGPAYIRSGLEALLIFQSAEAASPYKIQVLPGDASVPRGGDQTIRATLEGFASKDVTLMMKAAGGEFQSLPLIATADPAQFEGMMFRLDKDTEYYVRSNGVDSSHFTLKVVDLPTVQKLDLEYRYPAYTNLPPRIEENGSDIVALRGTEMLLRIVPTMKTSVPSSANSCRVAWPRIQAMTGPRSRKAIPWKSNRKL